MDIVFKAFCGTCDTLLNVEIIEKENQVEKTEIINSSGMIHALKNIPVKVIEVIAIGHMGEIVFKLKENQITLNNEIVILPTSFSKMKVVSIKYLYTDKKTYKSYDCSVCKTFIEVEVIDELLKKETP